MKRFFLLFLSSFLFIGIVDAQQADSYDLAVGLKFQKTEQLYWENGVGVDYTSGFLFDKQVHLTLGYITSRLGSAMIGNAVKQDNYLLGADWHFRSKKDFQILAGINTGFFHADMEIPQFEVLPHNSMLLSLETGLYYRFKFPASASLTVGYNLITGDGMTTPGTLFPLFYQLSVYYRLK